MKRSHSALRLLAVAMLLCLMFSAGPIARAQQEYLPQEDYETPEVPIWGPTYGDTDGDGSVTGKDLILLRQKLAGWDVTLNTDNADTNADGKVDGKDLILLRQVLAGWDVEMGPAPEGDEHSIVGDWVTVTRYDDEYRNTAEVLATFMSFYEDGTGEYSKGAWGNHDDSGNPSDSWEPQPMGYPTFSFTYTLDGDQLSITIYYEDDVTVWRTEEHTVSWNEDGSITLTDECYRLMTNPRMTVEELLILFGLDPNVPHSDLYIPGVDVEDVIVWFAEVALDAEFSDGGNANVIQKWKAPIQYSIEGNPTEKDMEVLNNFVAWLNTLEGFPGMAEAEKNYMANLQIHFCTSKRLVEILGNNFYGCDGGVTFWYDGNNNIYRSTICYSNEIDQIVRNSVILEEIYNGLGPVQDTDLREDSICYSGYSFPQELTEVDELILKLLYHPSIQPGMNYDECAAVIRELYY